MHNKNKEWELTILDGLIMDGDGASLAVGDIDGDGVNEIVVGGNGGLYWYKPNTLEKGIIDEGGFGVGLVLEDIDNDGLPEIITGKDTEGRYKGELTAYKMTESVYGKWESVSLSPDFAFDSHDILFADIDGDGIRELVCTGCPGLYFFKQENSPMASWTKYLIDDFRFSEGLNIADIDGDGTVEVICGPYIYKSPKEGPCSGLWECDVYIPGFRELLRTALIDITGNGLYDIVAMESEYLDGRISWFENPGSVDAEWVEHPIDTNMVYGHSLNAWNNDGEIFVFAGEMAQGGWNVPYNHDAKLLLYISSDNGETWRESIIERGLGTHQAVAFDLDGDGEIEIAGKTWNIYWNNPKLQVWKKNKSFKSFLDAKHILIDRDKEYAATDILWVDITDSGNYDLVCGAWWYRYPDWKKYDIPGILQVINSYDIDGDGKEELICTYSTSDNASNLSNELCWIKPIHPEAGVWEKHIIGQGSGDWPHGSVIAPFLSGGKAALILGYHSAYVKQEGMDMFLVPDNPTKLWEKKILTEFSYAEEMLAYDIDGDGNLDIIAGRHILRNMGDGTFSPYKLADGIEPARVAIADINNNGLMDIVIGEGTIDYSQKKSAYSKVLWLENPGNPFAGEWKVHVVDTVRCPHSIAACDIDGDGQTEILCGEHDPFSANRNRCKFIAYKKADPKGLSWKYGVLDDKHEHHCGIKPVKAANDNLLIASHGWSDKQYVHLWEIKDI